MRQLLLDKQPVNKPDPSSPDWVPDWWGTDEQNYRDARQFSGWVRGK